MEEQCNCLNEKTEDTPYCETAKQNLQLEEVIRSVSRREAIEEFFPETFTEEELNAIDNLPQSNPTSEDVMWMMDDNVVNAVYGTKNVI